MTFFTGSRCILALAVALGACGEQSYIELNIDDELADTGVSLVVGATDASDDVEADEMRFDLFRDDAGTDLIVSKNFALDPTEHTFPLKVLMEPVDNTPDPVSVHVFALREDGIVASGGVEIDWQAGVISLVPVQLQLAP